jgi:hypothetical protein
MEREGAAVMHLSRRRVHAPEDAVLQVQNIRQSIGDRIHQLTSGRNDFGCQGPDLRSRHDGSPEPVNGWVFTGIWYKMPAPVIC